MCLELCTFTTVGPVIRNRVHHASAILNKREPQGMFLRLKEAKSGTRPLVEQQVHVSAQQGHRSSARFPHVAALAAFAFGPGSAKCTTDLQRMPREPLSETGSPRFPPNSVAASQSSGRGGSRSSCRFFFFFFLGGGGWSCTF